MSSYSFHETKQHGTVQFPAEYYYLDNTHPRYHMSFHWHKEWELIRVISGVFTAHIDEVEYTAVPGDVLLIRSSMLHGGTPADCVYECLVFDLHGLFRSSEIIKKHIRPIYRMQLLPHIHYHGEPTVSALVAAIMESCAAKSTDQEGIDHSELMFLGCVCNLFAYIIKNGFYTENKEDLLRRSHRVEQIKSVLEYIEQEYASQITLEELSRLAGMNPNYFCRLFKEITHQTPIAYVLFYRIEQASTLLTTTSLPLTEIAMACGFNDYSYFIRAFNRLKGTTPKQFRKNNMELTNYATKPR